MVQETVASSGLSAESRRLSTAADHGRETGNSAAGPRQDWRMGRTTNHLPPASTSLPSTSSSALFSSSTSSSSSTPSPSSSSLLHLFLLLSSCLVLLSLPVPARAGSGQCKLNFQEYQNRRRSAIQAQILSKLGLTAPPSDIGPAEVPEEVLAMYNETVRILEERRQMMQAVCQQESKSEDYFAKVPKIYFVDKSEHSDNYKTMKMKQSKFFRFDLSNYVAEVNSDEVFEAEMRLYQLRNEMKAAEDQHIDVYQLIPNSNSDPTRKHIYSTVLNTGNEGWIKIDVTEAVRDWITIPESNLGIEITRPCHDCIIHVQFADPRGTWPTVEVAQRGDQTMPNMSPKEKHPRLVVLAPANDTLGPPQQQQRRHRRSPSTYGQNVCADQTQPSCCLRQFYVNFKRHLGWGWIRQPKGYFPNYCAGSCSYVNGSVWNAQTNHGSVLETYRQLNPDASPSPCCSPRSFKPLHILFYDKGKPLFRELPNAIVMSCQCS